jgi:hypothetical protein
MCATCEEAVWLLVEEKGWTERMAAGLLAEITCFPFGPGEEVMRQVKEFLAPRVWTGDYA